jgi:hypothetical protein
VQALKRTEGEVVSNASRTGRWSQPIIAVHTHQAAVIAASLLAASVRELWTLWEREACVTFMITGSDFVHDLTSNDLLAAMQS